MYKEVIEKLEDNRTARLEGRQIAIPWELDRLSSVLPGITKKSYVGITGASKSAKSQMCDYLDLYQPIEWLLNNPDSRTKIKIIYFSLEISKENKMIAAMSYLLFKEHDVIVSPQDLQSLFSGKILDERILNLCKSKKFQQWFAVFDEVVDFYDDIRSGYSMYNLVKTYAEANGKYTYKTIDWTNDDGSVTKKNVIDSYKANDPDEYVIVITDHLALLQPSAGKSLHQAMGEYSSEYCLKMRDRFGYTIVDVIQQAMAGEDLQFTNKGVAITDKLHPSVANLGDN